MKVAAALITKPEIDFDTFLLVTKGMLGRSPATTADANPIELCDADRFVWCLAAIDKCPPCSIHLLAHVSFSVMLAASEADCRKALNICAGMSAIQAETNERDYVMVVVSGTLLQWRDAVSAGLKSDCAYIFEEIKRRFVGARLESVFK